MLIILSPAKTLDFDTASHTVKSTKPPMLTKAEELIRVMRRKDVKEIRQLMKVSEKIEDNPPAKRLSLESLHIQDTLFHL